jgi:hypothetical protein
MLLFRSEEHVELWCRAREFPTGGLLTLDQGWRLAVAWFGERRSPRWRRGSPEEIHALFERLGLTGPFWRLDA